MQKKRLALVGTTAVLWGETSGQGGYGEGKSGAREGRKGGPNNGEKRGTKREGVETVRRSEHRAKTHRNERRD